MAADATNHGSGQKRKTIEVPAWAVVIAALGILLGDFLLKLVTHGVAAASHLPLAQWGAEVVVAGLFLIAMGIAFGHGGHFNGAAIGLLVLGVLLLVGGGVLIGVGGGFEWLNAIENTPAA